MASNTRLYGTAIAFASGLYSLWNASMDPAMSMDGGLSTSATLMLVLGIVVVVHGVLLLTGHADRLGGASGPLMIGYAVVMLLNQAALATGMTGSDSADMGGGMGSGMGQSGMTSAMGWDPGMVALALLMLASGLIMTRDAGMDGDGNGM
jgi:membrane protein insertase Oxa1/YidC/SpoIIIJ